VAVPSQNHALFRRSLVPDLPSRASDQSHGVRERAWERTLTYVEASGGGPDAVAFRVEDCGFVDIAGADQTGEGVLVSGGAGEIDVEPHTFGQRML